VLDFELIFIIIAKSRKFLFGEQTPSNNMACGKHLLKHNTALTLKKFLTG